MQLDTGRLPAAERRRNSSSDRRCPPRVAGCPLASLSRPRDDDFRQRRAWPRRPRGEPVQSLGLPRCQVLGDVTAATSRRAPNAKAAVGNPSLPKCLAGCAPPHWSRRREPPIRDESPPRQRVGMSRPAASCSACSAGPAGSPAAHGPSESSSCPRRVFPSTSSSFRGRQQTALRRTAADCASQRCDGHGPIQRAEAGTSQSACIGAGG